MGDRKSIRQENVVYLSNCIKTTNLSHYLLTICKLLSTYLHVFMPTFTSTLFYQCIHLLTFLLTYLFSYSQTIPRFIHLNLYLNQYSPTYLSIDLPLVTALKKVLFPAEGLPTNPTVYLPRQTRSRVITHNTVGGSIGICM